MMDFKGRNSNNTSKNSPSSSSTTTQSDDEMMSDLRRGPWTVEEDFKLMNYIATNGEGRWNSLARSADLKRTGKSCRLRWLNYLRPDVRRGNITLEEQLMILELHSRWGNRWSKIAQHLPGRTDNEIKNYWRTRVQKHAKQLKCDVNSKQFKDTMRYLWMPRLIERIQAANTTAAAPTAAAEVTHHQHVSNPAEMGGGQWGAAVSGGEIMGNNEFAYAGNVTQSYITPESSSTAASSDSFGTPVNQNPNPDNYFQTGQVCYSDSMISPSGYFNPGFEFLAAEPNNMNQSWLDGGDTTDNLWNVEDIWFNNM